MSCFVLVHRRPSVPTCTHRTCTNQLLSLFLLRSGGGAGSTSIDVNDVFSCTLSRRPPPDARYSQPNLSPRPLSISKIATVNSYDSGLFVLFVPPPYLRPPRSSAACTP
ncbi:hypothetical protein SCHPADRAFT_752781 [Schizopora paradoxa]|uniref:Uncharacterized protein n=1 Tax=Schizopora paradoxa TaxID=27342 RepID=A0A0H2QYN7_9AGAM|nr:hypothetical protein SCHPADRAFT_752781 [Schizopora paradoxa]